MDVEKGAGVGECGEWKINDVDRDRDFISKGVAVADDNGDGRSEGKR